jgi:hypothetical protein
MQNGKYDACSDDDPTPPPSSSQVIPPPPVALVVKSDPDEGGLASWAILLIVIFILLLVCCIGYVIAVIYFEVANCLDDCFRDHGDTQRKSIIMYTLTTEVKNLAGAEKCLPLKT